MGDDKAIILAATTQITQRSILQVYFQLVGGCENRQCESAAFAAQLVEHEPPKIGVAGLTLGNCANL